MAQAQVLEQITRLGGWVRIDYLQVKLRGHGIDLTERELIEACLTLRDDAKAVYSAVYFAPVDERIRPAALLVAPAPRVDPVKTKPNGRPIGGKSLKTQGSTVVA
jgi:hypothetical protein